MIAEPGRVSRERCVPFMMLSAFWGEKGRCEGTQIFRDPVLEMCFSVINNCCGFQNSLEDNSWFPRRTLNSAHRVFTICAFGILNETFTMDLAFTWTCLYFNLYFLLWTWTAFIPQVVIDGAFSFILRRKVPVNVSYGLQFTHYFLEGRGCLCFASSRENIDSRCGKHVRCCSHLQHNAATQARLFCQPLTAHGGKSISALGPVTASGPWSHWFRLCWGKCSRIPGFISGAVRKAEPSD